VVEEFSLEVIVVGVVAMTTLSLEVKLKRSISNGEFEKKSPCLKELQNFPCP
jgi:hypothetical protein